MSIVVTALGAFTPLADTYSQTWVRLCQGESGLSRLDRADLALELPSGESISAARDFVVGRPRNPDEFLSPKLARSLDTATKFAYLACLDALIAAQSENDDANNTTACEDSAAYYQPADPARLTAIFNSTTPGRRITVFAPGLGNISSVIEAWETYKTKPARLNPFTIPMLMGNSAAATIAKLTQSQAGAHSPLSACSSGAEAIAYAAQALNEGRAEIAFAGGTDAGVHPVALQAFDRMRALTKSTDPQNASLPFSAGRSGFVMAQGASCLILETAENAAQRGANVIAELAGWGYSCDAYDVAAPNPSGQTQKAAIYGALKMAGIDPSDIDLVCPHATSTPAGDQVEADIIDEIFPHSLVFATKGATGHLLGAAGAIEAAFTVSALKTGLLPPTLGCHEPIFSGFSINSSKQAEKINRRAPLYGLSTSFGFGGHNVALIFKQA